MNFPLEYPVYRFLYWLFNTAGVGGAIVTVIAVTLIVSYGAMLRWIARGAEAPETRSYLFPPHHTGSDR
ncbi:MAG: hypothetical protein Kow0047_15240 [Anaerolineae bacterium]